MKLPVRQTLLLSSLASAVAFITACGGGGAGSPPPVITMQVRGLASGATLSVATGSGQTIDVRQDGSTTVSDIDTKRWTLTVKPDNQFCGMSASTNGAQIDCKTIGAVDSKLWVMPENYSLIQSAMVSEDGKAVIAAASPSGGAYAPQLLKITASGTEVIAALPNSSVASFDGITRLPNGNYLVYSRTTKLSTMPDLTEVTPSGVVTPYDWTGDYTAERPMAEDKSGQTSSLITLDDGRILIVQSGRDATTSIGFTSLYVLNPQTKQIVKVMQTSNAILRPILGSDGKVYVVKATNYRGNFNPTYTDTLYALGSDNKLTTIPNVQPVQGWTAVDAMSFNMTRIGTDPSQWLIASDPTELAQSPDAVGSFTLCSGLTLGQWAPPPPPAATSVASAASAALLNFTATQAVKGGKGANGLCTKAVSSGGLTPLQSWTLVAVDNADGTARHYLADLHFRLKSVTIPPYTHDVESRYSVVYNYPFLGGQIDRKSAIQVIRLMDPDTHAIRVGVRILKLQ